MDLDLPAGYRARCSHLNIEHIAASVLPETALPAGAAFARTGSTWNGARSQKKDPHLHFGPVAISAYPACVEAYLRDYDDPRVAVAGGYGFGVAGAPVALDATRSRARPGRRITHYEWKLCDGTVAREALLSHTYPAPGFHAEELTLTFDDGSRARDVAQVRIFSGQGDREAGFIGWIHHTPVRGVVPGTKVTFQTALWAPLPGGTLEFGDGSAPVPCEEFVTHRYTKPGLYTATLTSAKRRVWLKAVVVVEQPRP